MKSLAKNSTFNAFYTIMNLLFPLITSVYVARVLLPEGIGKVAYAQSIVSYFVIIASLGLPNYGLREIARVRDKLNEKNKLFTELLIVNAISTSIALVSYIVLILLIPSLNSQFNLFVACGLLIFLNYFNIDWFYQGEEEYVFIVCRSMIIKILSILAIFLFVRKQSDYVIYAWISSIALGGNYIFNIIHARKYVSITFEDINIRPHIKPIMIMAVGVILASIYGKVDTTMLGIMSGERETGLYTNGLKIIDMVITTSTAITAVFMPRLSYYYIHDKNEFNNLIKKGNDILSFITFPICIGLFVIAPKAVQLLFGDEFIEAATIIRVLCILIVVKGFGNLLCFQLVMCTGNEKERIPATFLGSLSNVVMNAILIPIAGGVGAAFASVVSESIVNGYQLIKMKRKVDIRFDKKILMKSILSSIIMGGWCYFIGKLEVGLLISTVIVVLVGIITYIITSIMMKNEMLYIMIKMVKEKINRKKNNI